MNFIKIVQFNFCQNHIALFRVVCQINGLNKPAVINDTKVF